MQGDEVLRRLRQNPYTQSIPVIMISTDATPRQIDRLLAAGAAHYITKPVDVRKFLELLDRTLAGSVDGAEAREKSPVTLG
jgi:CheY-like chemotaxis protein